LNTDLKPWGYGSPAPVVGPWAFYGWRRSTSRVTVPVPSFTSDGQICNLDEAEQNKIVT